MHVSARKAALVHWLDAGYIKVLKVKSGSDLVAAQRGSAASAPRRQATEQPPLDFSVVNRYGSHGLSMLMGSGMALYDEAPNVISDAVMEDNLGDPVELLRTEDDEHTHLAPCAVPETSEARAQYCLTLMQLVHDDIEQRAFLECVRALVLLPVSPLLLGAVVISHQGFHWQTTPRDTTTQEQIVYYHTELVAPASVTWDSSSPLLQDAAVLDVYRWLASSAYRAGPTETGGQGAFLGWDQAWKYALGLAMFLVSKTSRKVSAVVNTPALAYLRYIGQCS